MKRKLLTIVTMLLVCCTAMFMFSGCEQRKVGTLTADNTTIAEYKVYTKSLSHASVEDMLDGSDIRFTYVGAADDAEDAAYAFEKKLYREIAPLGAFASNFVTSTGTHTLVVNYRGAECKITYTIVRDTEHYHPDAQ